MITRGINVMKDVESPAGELTGRPGRFLKQKRCQSNLVFRYGNRL